MNKRGQFFLIAALVIVGIVIMLTTINVSTRTTSTKDSVTYDLSKEVGFESNSLIDYGVYNKKTLIEINSSVDALVSNYSAVYTDTDLYFAYGDANEIIVTSYVVNSSGRVSDYSASLPQTRKVYSSAKQVPFGNEVNVTLSDKSVLNFSLGPGQNFFIVLKRDIGGETIVAKS